MSGSSFTRAVASLLLFLASVSFCIRYDPDQVLWNLNQNETATEVMDYWGKWENHSESPRTFFRQDLTFDSVQPLSG